MAKELRRHSDAWKPIWDKGCFGSAVNSGFQPKMKKYGRGEMELGDILDCAYELVGEENRLKTQEAFIAGMMFYRWFIP